MGNCKKSVDAIEQITKSMDLVDGDNGGIYKQLMKTEAKGSPDVMAQDGAKARIEDTVKNLVQRSEKQSQAVFKLQDELEEMRITCRYCAQNIVRLGHKSLIIRAQILTRGLSTRLWSNSSDFKSCTV